MPEADTLSQGIDPGRLEASLAFERARYVAEHQRSRALHEEAADVLMAGVPMTWMSKWPGGFPLFFDSANGNRLRDVDGREYLDFCLGDSAAIAGHGDAEITRAIVERYGRGATAMLPTPDGLWVAAELRRRFGLEVWQFTTSATDANRWLLRMSRHVTRRPRILVMNGCYHGTVDEAVVSLDREGRPRSRPGNVGPAVDPTSTTRVVEWNDPEALEEAFASEDVAAVIAEPVMTNAGMVQPAPGYHDALRRLARQHGSWLILDETQTWAAGPGGCTQALDLDPDAVTLGKGMAGGIAIGTLGLRRVLADAVLHAGGDLEDGGSVGGTLAANALSLAAARATLGNVLTDEAFARMVDLAERYVTTMRSVFAKRDLPWYMTNVGARAEYGFCPPFPQNGSQANAAANAELDEYLHLALLNRGFLQTPFHNMVLVGASTASEDVDRLIDALTDAIDAVIGWSPPRSSSVRPGRADA
jgi:glutamate-1-semialdehyde 2,1-aminomutase